MNGRREGDKQMPDDRRSDQVRNEEGREGTMTKARGSM